MRKSNRIVAPLGTAFFLGASLVAPVVQSDTLSSGTKSLRGNANVGRDLEDLEFDDDFFDDDGLFFDDDVFTGGTGGAFAFLSDKDLAECLQTDLPALTETESAAYEEANTAFLDAAPADPSILLELTFTEDARTALRTACDEIGGFFLDQSGPLSCDFPTEDSTETPTTPITTVLKGFAQCFPPTDACTNVDANAFMAFTFSLAGADCDFEFEESEPVVLPVEEGPLIEEEEEIEQEIEEEEEEDESEESDADLPVDPNPPPEVTTVVTPIEPEIEFPHQNIVLPSASTAGYTPRASK